MVKCVYRSEGCDLTRPKVEQKWTNMKWMFDESVVELKPNMPTCSSLNHHPKRWFHVVPFNGIAMIDAIFEKKFPDRFPAFKGDVLHLETKQFGWPLQYEQPGILGSGIPVPLFTLFFATKMRLEKKQPPHATSVKPSGIPAETFGSPPSKDCRFSRKLPLQLTHLQTCSIYCYKLRYTVKVRVPFFFLVSVCFFCFVGWYAKKHQETHFNIQPLNKSSVHFDHCCSFAAESGANDEWANSWKTRSTTSPRPYPKLIWNQQTSNVLGFGVLFSFWTCVIFRFRWHKSTASPGHRSLNPSLSPLDKPRVVTFMINTCRVKDTKNQQRDMILYSVLFDTLMKSLPAMLYHPVLMF